MLITVASRRRMRRCRRFKPHMALTLRQQNFMRPVLVRRCWAANGAVCNLPRSPKGVQGHHSRLRSGPDPVSP